MYSIIWALTGPPFTFQAVDYENLRSGWTPRNFATCAPKALFPKMIVHFIISISVACCAGALGLYTKKLKKSLYDCIRTQGILTIASEQKESLLLQMPRTPSDGFNLVKPFWKILGKVQLRKAHAKQRQH